MHTYLGVSIPLFAMMIGSASAGNAQSVADAATLQIRHTSFAPSLHVNIDSSYETPSGTFVRDLVPGNGVPQGVFSKVVIDVRMWLADGQLLAHGAILNPADTLSIDTGRRALIRGLLESIRGMRLGGVRQLVIPSVAGWGPAGRVGVSPNAVVVAEVALTEVTRGGERIAR